MPNNDRTKTIYRRTPESAAMLANVKRAMAITAALNRLTFNDADEIRALFSELIGKKVDESFLLIPPFYTAGGDEIRVGHNVFVNQNCTFYDLGGLDIADDVMIGPNVSIITTGHPLEPSQRRAATIGKPIVIEKNVWIAAGATILGGVTVGENSVVAAGSGVTKGRSPEYSCRRKSGAGHSFDSRLRERPQRVEAGNFKPPHYRHAAIVSNYKTSVRAYAEAASPRRLGIDQEDSTMTAS